MIRRRLKNRTVIGVGLFRVALHSGGTPCGHHKTEEVVSQERRQNTPREAALLTGCVVMLDGLSVRTVRGTGGTLYVG